MASDNDEPNTPNSQVSFSILNSSFPFIIDPVMGNASVSQPIAQSGLYEVFVEVSDQGEPELTSIGVFDVIVAPPNADSPAFPIDFTATFNENDNSSDPVYTFTVTDGDEGDEGMVTISLLPSQYSGDFRLEQDGNTGQLYTNTLFDRETTSNFSLSVKAVDNGNSLFRRTSEAELTVIILDINDNTPIFENAPYEVSVPEDAPQGYNILQVYAMDADIGTNAEIMFSLIDAANFGIDATSGNVTVQGPLHRATTPFYMIEIVATDQGAAPMYTQTYINITVTEVNDNNPVFDVVIPTSITINEDTAPGYEFVEVNATDADTGPAGMVDFSLVQTGDVFALQGDIMVLNMLVDYEVCIFTKVLSACMFCYVL